MCPKTERDRGNDAVVCIASVLPEISDYPQYLIFLRSILNHTSGLHLILYPFGIIEYVLIMSVYGIAEYHLKDIQYAIKLLA